MSGQYHQFKVSPWQRGQRLDWFLHQMLPQHSRSRLQRLIREGRVSVNRGTAKAGYKVQAGDEVKVFVPPPEPLDLTPWPYPLQILYEDTALLAVNKPPGMVVHPSPGHRDHTLVHALLARGGSLSQVGGTMRPGIVHRLDKDTSGVLLVARSDRAHQELSRQFKQGEVGKTYLALVRGFMSAEQGVIEAPIGRHPVNRKKMSARSRSGKQALTMWRVKQEFSVGVSLLELELKTGRTHQIRVHLALVGRPVLGDSTYGGKAASLHQLGDPELKKVMQRHMLHARAIAFNHPLSGDRLVLRAPLPGDMVQALELLKKNEKKS